MKPTMKIIKLIAASVLLTLSLTSCIKENRYIDLREVSLDDPRLKEEIVAGLQIENTEEYLRDDYGEVLPPNLNAIYADSRIFDLDGLSVTFYYGFGSETVESMKKHAEGVADAGDDPLGLAELDYWNVRLTLYSERTSKKYVWYNDDLYSSPESYLADIDDGFSIPDSYSDYSHSENVSIPRDVFMRSDNNAYPLISRIICKAEVLGYKDASDKENAELLDSFMFWLHYQVVEDKIVIYDYHVL